MSCKGPSAFLVDIETRRSADAVDYRRPVLTYASAVTALAVNSHVGDPPCWVNSAIIIAIILN
jgi:hypothetical protein